VNGQNGHNAGGFSTESARILTPQFRGPIPQSVAIRGDSAPNPWQSVKTQKRFRVLRSIRADHGIADHLRRNAKQIVCP
jgi:hypothetical protein